MWRCVFHCMKTHLGVTLVHLLVELLIREWSSRGEDWDKGYDEWDTRNVISHWSLRPLTTTYLFTYSFSCVCTLPSTCAHSLFSDRLHQHAGSHYVSMVTNICQWNGVTLVAKWRWEWEINVKTSRQNLFLIWKFFHSELSVVALRLPPPTSMLFFHIYAKLS